MKNILLFASALAGLFLAGSCQKESLEPAAQGSVTYEITLPDGPQTKGELGYQKYDLHYEVYKTVNRDDLADLTKKPLFEKTVPMEGHTHKLQLDLLNDQDYTILFWANKQGEDYFDLTDLRQVGVKQASANNDDRDAFCGMDQLKQHDGAQSKTVELKRPFAQINIATIVPTADKIGYDVTPLSSRVKVKNIPVKYNVFTGEPVDDDDAVVEVDYTVNLIPEGNLTVNTTEYKKVAMNYALVPATQDNSATVEVYYEINTVNGTVNNTIPNVPVKKNYRTNIIGNLLTSNATYNVVLLPGFEEPAENVEAFSVSTASELSSVIANASSDVETNIKLEGDINLNDLLTKSTASEAKLVIPAGKELLIDLNGKTLYGTSNVTGKNFEMIDVRGNLTVVNGTVTAQFLGQDMGWGASTNVFNITAGGVLNLKNVTAKNLGGSAMAFVAHLNNWGEATINVENSVLESPYIAVRVFNSGPDMNNVTIKKSTLKGKYCFWVHNYKAAGDSNGEDATLNVDIFNGTNTFVYNNSYNAPVLYGFNSPIYLDENGNVLQQNNEIWYTATALVHAHWYTDKFGEGTDLVSNVWDETTGKGVITLSGPVTVIGTNAFYEREHLTSVSLPNSVTEIGEDAFDYCPNLTSVKFSENLVTIGISAFGACGKLTNVVLPESLTTIGASAFNSCTALKSITIPAGVTSIGDYAFNGITDLKVYCKSTTPPAVGSTPFNKWWAEIYVPAASLAVYQEAWGSVCDNIYAE